MRDGGGRRGGDSEGWRGRGGCGGRRCGHETHGGGAAGARRSPRVRRRFGRADGRAERARRAGAARADSSGRWGGGEGGEGLRADAAEAAAGRACRFRGHGQRGAADGVPVEGDDGVRNELLGSFREDELPQLDLAAAAAEGAGIERVEGDGRCAGVPGGGCGEDCVATPVPKDDVVIGDVAKDNSTGFVSANVNKGDPQLSLASQSGYNCIHLQMIYKYRGIVQHPASFCIDYDFLCNTRRKCADAASSTPNERRHWAAPITVITPVCEI